MEKKRKKLNYYSEMLLGTQIPKLSLLLGFLTCNSSKPVSIGYLHNRNSYSDTLVSTHGSQLFKSNTSLTCQLPRFTLKSTTLPPVPIHCTHAECSTAPLTFTVSICPFTDSVLGGAPLDVETLTVERDENLQ